MPSNITWRRLQHVFSVTIFRLPRRHEDIFKMSSRPLGRKGIVTLKTSSRRLEDMSWRRLKDMSCLKTSWRHIFKTSRCFGDKTSSRCLGDKQNFYWGYLYLINLNVYLTNLYFTNLYLTKLRRIQNALIRTQ